MSALDDDGNGEIDKAEWDKAFDKIDTDKGGDIDSGEFGKFVKCGSKSRAPFSYSFAATVVLASMHSLALFV